MSAKSYAKTVLALVALAVLRAPAGAQSLYVATYDNNGIVMYAYQNGALNSNGTTFANNNSQPGSLDGPVALSFDRLGDLFVANASSNTIEEYTFSNGTLSNTGTQLINAGLTNPQDLAFGSLGDLFVANYGGGPHGLGYIEKYALNSNGTLNPNGTFFTDSKLDNPGGLTFDNAGNLFVANNSGPGANNGSIEEYTLNSDGTLNPDSLEFTRSGLDHPYGLAFDSTGDLFVANNGDRQTQGYIEEYARNSDGTFNSNGTFFTNSGLHNPQAVAFDSAGNLYVTSGNGGSSDNRLGTITEFAFNSVSGTLDPNGTTFTGGLNNPTGLAFSPLPAPEPSGWVSLGMGAFGLLGLRLRARRARSD